MRWIETESYCVKSVTQPWRDSSWDRIAGVFQVLIVKQLMHKIVAFNKAYSGADKSLAWPTPRCSLFDGENISFDASLVIYTRT